MAAESNFLVFGETEKETHPLIVIVGREPNNNMDRSISIGTYADQALEGEGKWPSRVQFWNNSYGLIGRYAGLSAASMKHEGVSRKSSPIAFTDASPISLDGSVTPYQKRKIREEISQEVLDSHIDDVFSHTEMWQRTRLVIIAGVKGCGLDKAVEPLESACERFNIPSCHVHSLSSMRHTQDSRVEQLSEHASVIESVLEEYLSNPDTDNVSQAA